VVFIQIPPYRLFGGAFICTFGSSPPCAPGWGSGSNRLLGDFKIDRPDQTDELIAESHRFLQPHYHLHAVLEDDGDLSGCLLGAANATTRLLGDDHADDGCDYSRVLGLAEWGFSGRFAMQQS
jgi:hypothetical protein